MSGQPRNRASAARRRAEEHAAKLDALEDGATVTSVAPLPDGSGRVVVRIGRVRLGPLDPECLERARIRSDAPLDSETRQAIAEGLMREAARLDAVRLLRARARSSRDLLGRLVAKGHGRAHAEGAIRRLEAARVLDDDSLARDRAGRIAHQGRTAPRGAEIKLRAMGIDARLAAVATAEAFEGVDLLERATELADRRAATLPPNLDDITIRRRLYGFLARRGYDPDTCRTAIENAIGRAT